MDSYPTRGPKGDITNYTSPVLFGVIFVAFLYGIMTTQMVTYHSRKLPQERLYIQCLVYGLYLFETVTVLMIIHDAHVWLAAGFGNSRSLDIVNLGMITGPVMGSVVSLVTQAFYCWKILNLERKAWWLTVIIGLLALTATGTSVHIGIRATLLGRFSAIATLPPWYKITTYLSLISAAVVDLLITAAMSYLLLRDREYLRPHTKSVVKRVLLMTVETNLLSSSVAILMVILIGVVHEYPWHRCPSIVLGRIYSNSLLLLLNHRKHARDRLAATHVSFDLPPSIHSQDDGSLPAKYPNRQRFTIQPLPIVFRDMQHEKSYTSHRISLTTSVV